MRAVARAATPERLRVDIQVRAFYDVGDEDEALERLAEVYEDVWRQIRYGSSLAEYDREALERFHQSQGGDRSPRERGELHRKMHEEQG